MPTALITGISGQDGSILADFFSRSAMRVVGITRAESKGNNDLPPNCQIEVVPSECLTDQIEEIVARYTPNEIYHFAADSFIPTGWSSPERNIDSNYGLTLAILEAIRKRSPNSRLLNACSREVFGQTEVELVDETAPLVPRTPYGINKAASMWMVRAYRERYGVFAANAILFNHESPRRAEHFVTRKITKRVAEIKLGIAESLELGNLSVQRDWGYAGDFVDAMCRMLQLDEPEDFVVGTGILHSLEDVVRFAFEHVGLDWREHVRRSDDFVRQNDTLGCAADISKARQLLNWQPKVGLNELITMMVDADLNSLSIAHKHPKAA